MPLVIIVCEVDPPEAETKVGPLVRLSVELLASVNVSVRVRPVKLTSPVFLMPIVSVSYTHLTLPTKA